MTDAPGTTYLRMSVVDVVKDNPKKMGRSATIVGMTTPNQVSRPMSEFRPPEDYEPEDSLQENGLECCAGCEMQLGSESGHHGAVYTQSGTHHEYFLDTDPDDGPFFCPDCWPKVDAERRRQENQSLADF